MKFASIFIFSMLFSVGTYASCSGFRCDGVKITNLTVKTTGETIIATSGDESQLSCNGGNYGYISINETETNYAAIYSLLLAAHTTEHPVNVRTNNDTTPCKIIYVVSEK